MTSSVPNLTDLGFLKAENEMLRHFRGEVKTLLGIDGFPGSQPVSFNRGHLDELKRRNYYVCEKSDGVRCLLYFTKQTSPDGTLQELHFLIDRRNDYYMVPELHFPLMPDDPNSEIDWSSWHKDTLLDGELLWDTYPNGRRELKYLAFDTLCLDGRPLLDRPLDKRLAYFTEKVYKPYAALRKKFPEDCQRFPFTLEQKSFQLAYGTEMMFRDILPKLPHGSDGLIFTCQETPYKFKTDQHILKWKPVEENTIDFKMGVAWPPLPPEERRGEDDWEFDYDAMPTFTLYAFGGGDNDIEFAEMFVEPEEYEQMKQWCKENDDDGLHGQVVECHLDKQKRWRFFRFRTDKAEGNHISIVQKVLDSIKDGVTKEELINEASTIRTFWKQRQETRR